MKTTKNLIQLFLLGAMLSQTIPGRGQTTVTQIAAGQDHSLFVKSDGSLWGMGNNYYGELGNVPTGVSNFQPTLLVTNGVTAVSACGYGSFYQTGNSSLWAMGFNGYGQLGDGTTTDIHYPKIITTGFGLVTGTYHTLFLRSGPSSSRDLDAMGHNQQGDLGDGTTNNQSAPERIERDSTIVGGIYYVTAVAAGDLHSLFLKSDGSLWTAGFNYYGALGDGTYTLTNKAEKIVPSGVITIAASGYQSLFIKTDHSLWGMGDNQYGQLGNPGIGANTNQPFQIVPNNVTAVASASTYTLFTETDGSLWAMGFNIEGMLGDGTLNSTNKPERIVAGGVTAIAAGIYHSLFLTSDGSLWGMGGNYDGALGAAPAVNQLLPIEIVGPTVWNGGFETHDFLGWTRSGDANGVSINSANTYAHSGVYGAKMGPSGDLAFLSQTLTTIPGTNYLLSFWLNCDGFTPNQFSVTWNGTTLLNTINLGATGWTNIQFTVSATVTNTALQFSFRDDFSYLGFDDVSVVPLSKPALTGLTVAGTNLVLNAANGFWNGTYLTLMSTNMAKPQSQWTPIATNTLDGSGNFTITVTNAVKASDKGKFFGLELN